VDAADPCSYFAPVLRKLLTLLAICAGLTAVAEPARAAVSAVEAVRMVEGARLTCVARADVRPAMPMIGVGRSEDKAKPCPKPTVVVIVPTVMLQADRARE
jgi:hypothetical protein